MCRGCGQPKAVLERSRVELILDCHNEKVTLPRNQQKNNSLMKRSYSLLLASPILLAACSGGSGNQTSVNTEPQYAETLGSTQARYQNGESLAASGSMAAQVLLNYTDGSTKLIPANDVAIALGENGHPKLTFRGETYQFTAANAQSLAGGGTDGYEIELNDGSTLYVNLYVWGKFENLTDQQRNEYVQLIDYMVVTGNDTDGYTGHFANAVIGSETNPSALGNFTSKTYNGDFVTELNPQQYGSGQRSGRADRHRLTGDLQFSANFENDSVSATVTNIEERVYVQQQQVSTGNISGTITLSNGAIVGNSFSGSVSADTDLLNSIGATSLTGNYKGKFYGPDGDEVGGVLSGSTVENSGNRNFIGMFKGTSTNN